MITTETPHKLADIIRDTWPQLYRPSPNSKHYVGSNRDKNWKTDMRMCSGNGCDYDDATGFGGESVS